MIRTTLTYLGTICLLITGIASFPDECLSKELYCIEPIEYIMNISTNIQNNYFTVSSNILIYNYNEPKAIKLYVGRNCFVHQIHINSLIDNLPSLWGIQTEMLVSTNNRFNIWYVNLVEYIDKGYTKAKRKINFYPGHYRISARYTCFLDKVATVFTYVHQSGEKKYLILPRIPSEWLFPYWENAEAKARFTIRINHKHAERALSHVPGKKISERNALYTSFFITPLFTQLIATVIIPSECAVLMSLLDTVTMQTRLQVTKDISYALPLITDITIFIRNKIEKIIPVSYVRYIALPINSRYYETIVTTGFVIFRDADIAYNKDVNSIVKKKEVTCLVARSVLQEFFSNLLPRFKQSDSWFFEGFLTFYGVHIVDKIYDKSLMKSIVVQTRQEFLDYTEAFIKYDLPIQTNPFISRNAIFNKLWDKKAFSIFSMICDMLKSIVYNYIFEKAADFYYITLKTINIDVLSAYAICCVISKIDPTYNTQPNTDLWTYVNLEAAMYKNPYVKNIKNAITCWITQTRYPIVQVKRHSNTQFLKIMVIDCFLDNQKKLCERKWWIPVTYLKLPHKYSLIHEFLSPDRENISFSNIKEEDSIILINHSGYRVNYDRTSWKNIALFLQTRKSKIESFNIDDVSLAQILEDAFYFLVQNIDYNEHSAANDTDLDVFFDLVRNAFHVKTSHIVWYPVLNALQCMSKIFPFPESAKIKEKILEILHKFLEDENVLHINSFKNTVSNQLYYEVIKWTCILDDLKCKQHVTTLVNWHFQNFAQYKWLPSWQKWIYCEALWLNNVTSEISDTWQKILYMYPIQWESEEIFVFLPCFRHDKIIYFYAYLSLLDLDPNFILSSQLSSHKFLENLKRNDAVTLYFKIVAKRSKNIASLSFIISGLENVIGRNIAAVVDHIINHIYSEEGLLKITDEKFLKNLLHMHRMPFLVDAIKIKAVHRRNYLRKMKNNILHSFYNVFKY